MKETIFVTGTDTGVGKTAFAGWLTEFLRRRGAGVAALKPVCSGGRGDARVLQAAMGHALGLEEVNPWHFRAAISPSMAARREGKGVSLAAVLGHIRRVGRDFEVVIVEGAGGLLSPLGRGFDSRDLIMALGATPIVVAANRLGVVNQILLTLEALPKNSRSKAKVVLMEAPKPNLATRLNGEMLRQLVSTPVYSVPWFGGELGKRKRQGTRLQGVLGAVAGGW